jgi:NTP pyrophosphatase (non-canonical NTP hydrolase)
LVQSGIPSADKTFSQLDKGENVSNEMAFGEAIELFRRISHRFKKIEGRPWGVEGAMIELVKQVGELAKHVMVAEHYYYPGREKMRGYETSKEIIGDELADILAMVIQIADYYELDLIDAHIKARKSEDELLTRMGA